MGTSFKPNLKQKPAVKSGHIYWNNKMNINHDDKVELLELIHDLELTITDKWQMMKIRQIKAKIVGDRDQFIRKQRIQDEIDNFDFSFKGE